MNNNNNKIIIPGNPIPLKRPRFSRTGSVYNAQKKIMLEISFIIKSQYHNETITGPVEVNMVFFMPIPKHLSLKKQRELNDTYHVKRQDIDNIFKFYADCITYSGIWTDDSLMCEISATKVYDLNPRTEITLTPY